VSTLPSIIHPSIHPSVLLDVPSPVVSIIVPSSINHSSSIIPSSIIHSSFIHHSIIHHSSIIVHPSFHSFIHPSIGPFRRLILTDVSIFHPSIHLSSIHHPFIYRSIHRPSFHRSFLPSFHPSIDRSIHHLSVHPSFFDHIDPSIHRSCRSFQSFQNDPSINPSIVHPLILSSIHWSFHPSPSSIIHHPSSIHRPSIVHLFIIHRPFIIYPSIHRSLITSTHPYIGLVDRFSPFKTIHRVGRVDLPSIHPSIGPPIDRFDPSIHHIHPSVLPSIHRSFIHRSIHCPSLVPLPIIRSSSVHHPSSIPIIYHPFIIHLSFIYRSFFHSFILPSIHRSF